MITAPSPSTALFRVASAAPSSTLTTSSTDMLGLRLLVALVVGYTIGSGIFGPPQNMSGSAGTNVLLMAGRTAP